MIQVGISMISCCLIACKNSLSCVQLGRLLPRMQKVDCTNSVRDNIVSKKKSDQPTARSLAKVNEYVTQMSELVFHRKKTPECSIEMNTNHNSLSACMTSGYE